MNVSFVLVLLSRGENFWKGMERWRAENVREKIKNACVSTPQYHNFTHSYFQISYISYKVAVLLAYRTYQIYL